MIFCHDMEHLSNNTTVAVVNDEKVTGLWSAYSSITYVGSVVGCLTVSIMADCFGRKNSLLIATGLCGLMSLLQNLAIYLNIYPLLLIGRIFNGHGAAVSSSLTSLYLSEIAPEHLRWGFASADTLFMISGGAIPAVLALPSMLGSSSLWTFIFIVGAALLLPILFLACQPEAPKFLSQKKKSRKAIVSSIYHYQGADADVSAIIENLEKPVTPISDRPVCGKLALFSQRKWRNHVLITLALSNGLAFSGTFVVLSYSTSIIVDAGVNLIQAKRCFLGVSLVRIVVTVIIALKIDKISSRRNVLLCTLWAIIGVLVGLILVSLIDVYGLKSSSANVHIFPIVVTVFLIFSWSGLVGLLEPLCVVTNLQCYPQVSKDSV